MIYTVIQKNGLPKGFYTEEVHGSFKLRDKKNKEKISFEEYEKDTANYEYSKIEEKYFNQDTNQDDVKVTYYRIPLIDNPECKIPKDAVLIPQDIYRKHINGQKQCFVNGEWQDYQLSDKAKFNKFKNRLLKKVNYLSDKKLKDVKNFIAGREIGIEDEERYKYKYQLAINNADELLKGEANKRGLSVDDFKKIIIEKHSEWMETIYYFSQKIEEFRVVFDDMINNTKTLQDLELIEYKIDILKTLNKKISDEDFDKILNLDKIDKEVEAMTETKKENIFTMIFNKLFNKG